MKIHIGKVNCTLLTTLFVLFKAVDKCQHQVCNQGEATLLKLNYFLFSSIQILYNIYAIWGLSAYFSQVYYLKV